MSYLKNAYYYIPEDERFGKMSDIEIIYSDEKKQTEIEKEIKKKSKSNDYERFDEIVEESIEDATEREKDRIIHEVINAECPYEFAKTSLNFREMIDYIRDMESTNRSALRDENQLAEMVARMIDEYLQETLDRI